MPVSSCGPSQDFTGPSQGLLWALEWGRLPRGGWCAWARSVGPPSPAGRRRAGPAGSVVTVARVGVGLEPPSRAQTLFLRRHAQLTSPVSPVSAVEKKKETITESAGRQQKKKIGEPGPRGACRMQGPWEGGSERPTLRRRGGQWSLVRPSPWPSERRLALPSPVLGGPARWVRSVQLLLVLSALTCQLQGTMLAAAAFELG